MKLFIYTAILFSGLAGVSGQNYVPNNGEICNFNNIDINKSATWTTYRSSTPGKFTNYDVAKFTNGTTSIAITDNLSVWINGYVKHIATATSISHVYPVGGTAKMFLSTASEKPDNSISVAWIDGNPSNPTDPTSPNAGAHLINTFDSSSPTLKSVSTIGQWDWVASAYTNEVTVIVKLPATLPINTSPFTVTTANNANLRLVGWSSSGWKILGTAGSTSSGTLSGAVPSSITALGIGSIATTPLLTKTNQDQISSVQTITDLVIFPNPAKSESVTLEFRSKYVGNGKILCYDELGKMVLSQKIQIQKRTSTTFNTNNLQSGVYFIKLTDNLDQPLAESQKLIMQ